MCPDISSKLWKRLSFYEIFLRPSIEKNALVYVAVFVLPFHWKQMAQSCWISTYMSKQPLHTRWCSHINSLFNLNLSVKHLPSVVSLTSSFLSNVDLAMPKEHPGEFKAQIYLQWRSKRKKNRTLIKYVKNKTHRLFSWLA